jgi:hypothetical protein
MVAKPIKDSLVTGSVLNLVFQILLPTQPLHPGITQTLAVTVTAATCNCNLITWDKPASSAALTLGVSAVSGNTVTIPLASVNTASTTAVPEIRVCAITTPCVLTYTTSLVDKTLLSLPTFMSVSGTTLTVTPTTSAHLGTWTL